LQITRFMLLCNNCTLVLTRFGSFSVIVCFV